MVKYNSTTYSSKFTDNLITELNEFDKNFKHFKEITLDNVGKGAQRVGRKKFDTSITDWGVKRMNGRAGRFIFTPYGNSEGRNRSGKLMENFSYEVRTRGSSTSLTVGWVKNKEKYYVLQDLGFKNRYGIQAVINGVPFFGVKKRTVNTPGAHGLEAARKSVSRRIESALSSAWNAAVENTKANTLVLEKVPDKGGYPAFRDAFNNRNGA
jgi:hypothetical protein